MDKNQKSCIDFAIRARFFSHKYKIRARFFTNKKSEQGFFLTNIRSEQGFFTNKKSEQGFFYKYKIQTRFFYKYKIRERFLLHQLNPPIGFFWKIGQLWLWCQKYKKIDADISIARPLELYVPDETSGPRLERSWLQDT